MHIDYSPKIGKFVVSGMFTELEDLRAIPNRRYDKTSGFWIAGLTRANVNYLSRWEHKATKEATVMMKQVLQGPVIRKGALPVSFRFKTTPKPHQLEPLLRMQVSPEYALTMDPGTGKTKVEIDAAACRFQDRKLNAELVVCPNSIKSNWEDEIAIHSPVGYDVFIYEPAKRKRFEKWNKTSIPGKIKWLIIGVESFSQGSAWKVAEQFLVAHHAGFALDESSRIKTHDSTRTELIIRLGPFAKFRTTMTGTPISKGLHQFWPQYEFLNPGIVDMGFYAFRNHFSVMGGYKGKQIIASVHQDEFIDLVAPYTFRASKAECLKDLPPKVHQVRHVEPSAEQERIYNELLNEGLSWVGDKRVTYDNTLVRDLRLQQIAGGFVALSKEIEPPGPDEDLEAYFERIADNPAQAIPGANPKITELMAIIDETPGKVIIWSRFKPEIRAICEALRKEYGNESVVEFHGDINEDGRTLARRRFQNDPTCTFFVGQISTGGIGITLTAASTVVYFSNAWALEDRIQSEDRAHRIDPLNQDRDSVLYIDLLTKSKKPWVDTKIHQALKDGKDYTDVVLREIELAVT